MTPAFATGRDETIRGGDTVVLARHLIRALNDVRSRRSTRALMRILIFSRHSDVASLRHGYAAASCLLPAHVIMAAIRATRDCPAIAIRLAHVELTGVFSATFDGAPSPIQY